MANGHGAIMKKKLTILQAWERAPRRWEDAGKPIPCYESKYMKARAELAKAWKQAQNG